MIDLKHIGMYRENNRIEAKKALGGLPESIWETYSAFANTLGGVILLGVEEYKDHSLHVIDLPDPYRMVELFWEKVNDRRKTNTNILSRSDVFIHETEGKRMICINVPQADRLQRPVYINGHLSETYRRSGEGDYRCTDAEIAGMMRDAERGSRDLRVIDDAGMNDLNIHTFLHYRSLLSYEKPGAESRCLSDCELLESLYAARRDKNGILHPTAAGLLMFGKYDAITKAFPSYAVHDATEGHAPLALNIFDYYETVCHEINRWEVAEDICDAAKEALLNCLVNADYDGECGIFVELASDRFVFANPGPLRITLRTATTGGSSDPRNSAMTRLFAEIGKGSGQGSGIPEIASIARKHGFTDPEIKQLYDPDQTVFVFSMSRHKQDPPALPVQITRNIRNGQMAFVIQYLTEKITADEVCLQNEMNVSSEELHAILDCLRDQNVIMQDEEGRWKLQA